jgi:hypothetical protein
MLEWAAMAQEAFQNAKRLLAAAVPLHPAPQAELSLATDASDTHIGSIMQQNLGPLATTWFFSKKLTDTDVTPRSIVNCGLHMQQSDIFTIFVKIALSNCGQITKCL